MCTPPPLSEMQVLHRRIENIDATGKGRRMTTRIWSTRLALQRARILEELFLENEQEWRLYEELLAKRVLFDILALRLVPHSPGISRGRALFRLTDGRQCRYAGAAGFVVAYPGQAEKSLSGVSDVVEWIVRAHEPSR